MTPDDELAAAQRHVRESEARVMYQVRIVGKLKDRGLAIATHAAERLLMEMIATFSWQHRHLTELQAARSRGSSRT